MALLEVVVLYLLQSAPGVGLYHLAIKTGDERSAGTDANVWVQVYGDKGDTGHVQLKKSGMMENLFERGQTDYFTLEAGDVGKVSFGILSLHQFVLFDKRCATAKN